jgi:hypothetical protein
MALLGMSIGLGGVVVVPLLFVLKRVCRGA